MLFVTYKIRVLLATHTLLTFGTNYAKLILIFQRYIDFLNCALTRIFGIRNGGNVLWSSTKGLNYIFGIQRRWEVFQFAVPSMVSKRDFKARWKFYWDGMRAKGEEGTSCATPNFTINEVLLLPLSSPPLEKAKRLVSQCSVFSLFEVFRSKKLEEGTWNV